MTSRSMYSRANRIKEIIKSEKTIHKYDLMDRARISMSTYEKIKPWLEYRFADFFSYDKEKKTWNWMVEENTEEKIKWEVEDW